MRILKATDYRIESSYPISFRLLPVPDAAEYCLSDGALAVVIAAKSVTVPPGQEIRVVHIPTGEVLFRKAAALAAAVCDEA